MNQEYLEINKRVEDIITLIDTCSNDKKLTQYSNKKSLVICITAPYGAGKTTFAKKLEHELQKINKYQAVYLDLWKNSYLPPITHLSKGLLKVFRKEEKIKQIKSIIKKANKYIKMNLEMKGVGINVNKMINDALSESKDPIENFSNIITDYSTKKPIIFLLDEADRCEPAYLKTYLANIHHFFDIPNCIFILLLEPNYLKGLCSHEGYLPKFIDMTIPLYKNSFNELEKAKKIDVFKDFMPEKSYLADIIECCNLSMRDINQIKLQIYLLQKENKEIVEPYQELLFFILVFKAKHYELFTKLFHPNDYIKIIEKLDKLNTDLLKPFQLTITTNSKNSIKVPYKTPTPDLIDITLLKLKEGISKYKEVPSNLSHTHYRSLNITTLHKDSFQYLILHFAIIIYDIHHVNLSEIANITTWRNVKQKSKDGKSITCYLPQYWKDFLSLVYNFSTSINKGEK